MIEKQIYCPNCKEKVLAKKQETFSTGMGCFLTIITAGIFGLIWIPFVIIDGMKPFKCPNCGENL